MEIVWFMPFKANKYKIKFGYYQNLQLVQNAHIVSGHKNIIELNNYNVYWANKLHDGKLNPSHSHTHGRKLATST